MIKRKVKSGKSLTKRQGLLNSVLFTVLPHDGQDGHDFDGVSKSVGFVLLQDPVSDFSSVMRNCHLTWESCKLADISNR